MRKILYLFVALLLPGCIFLFLKIFGKNQFAVEPLYQETLPVHNDCPPAQLPYLISDSIRSQLRFEPDSLVLVVFYETDSILSQSLRRVTLDFPTLTIQSLNEKTSRNALWKRCVFFLTEPFDCILVDRKGILRGQYVSTDREEVDRLLTELAIIHKQY